jgi:hypothetical protein
MQFIDNTREILTKAWSVRFAVLSAFFAITEAVLPTLNGVLPPKTFAICAAISACGTVIARVIAQPGSLPGK